MSGQVSKPNHIFDRDREWKTLVRFATSESGDVRLGIVSGRRRQGKTYLLDAAATTFGGFFFAATDSTETESLASFGRALAGYGGGRYAFADWDEAVQRLFGVVSGGLIIIDEFPYLIERQPRAAVPDPARARSPGIRPAEPGADGAGRVGHVGHGAPARRKRAAARPGQHGNDHPAVRLPGRGEVLGHQRPSPGSARPLGRGRNARLPPRVRDGRRPRLARLFRSVGAADRAQPAASALPRSPLPAGGGSRHPRHGQLPCRSRRDSFRERHPRGYREPHRP